MVNLILLKQLYDYKYTLIGMLLQIKKEKMHGESKNLKKQIRDIDKEIKRILDN